MFANMHEIHVHCVLLLVLAVICVQSDSHEYLECNTAQGFHHLSLDKCVKVFNDQNGGLLSWQSAKDVCARYGANLVTIQDQYDNDRLGEHVANITGRQNTSYWIGLSNLFDDSCSCHELKWENGMFATENMGYWSDNQPRNGQDSCVFAQKDMEDYVYDRPHTWSYDNCYTKRAFVCEKKAATSGMFHCFSGGYIRMSDKCNGNSDCPDGSDEFNCTNRCAFLLQDVQGPLPPFNYLNAQTCTWAIMTEEGTSAFVELRDFQTEQEADYVNVFIGSIVETQATRVARLSGTITNPQQFQSYNNMMLIKFQSDSIVTRSGFVGRYGRISPPQGNLINLIARATPQESVTQQNVGTIGSFVGMYDYVYVIRAENDQIGKIITLEILNMMINNDEFIEIYDGPTPDSRRLARLCNTCGNPKVIFSTGRQMSVLYRRLKSLSMDIRFSFRYTEGCSFTTTDKWGTFSSPGYPMKYPNFVNCTWRIMPMEPFAVYFDMNLELVDEGNNLVSNADTLEMYDNGTRLHMENRGFNTSELAGQTFLISSGILEVRFNTSPIRSGIGFNATYSIGCPNPNYDQFTISNTGQVDFYYTAKMTLTCAQGYAFQQEQIPVNTLAVNVECGFMGMWKDYLQIPRCTPVYCGDVPPLTNGYIESSTGSVYNDVVTYQCFPGLTLRGSTTITCQSNGAWTPGPTCLVDTCNSALIPSSISNGQAEVTNGDGSSIGSIAEYRCNMGYELVGEPIIFCQTNATYTSTSVSCRRLRCQLPMIMNGDYEFLNPGDFVDYETVSNVICKSGYTLEDSSISSVTCQANREVTQVPVCIDINECDNSPCSQGCVNTVGTFYCTCNDGYELASNGVTCIDVDECTLDIDNCDQGCIDTEGSYTCTCQLPYVLFTMNGENGYTVPSVETGLLPNDTLHFNHSCVLIACPNPPEIDNGMVLDKRDTHRFGDYVEYKCDIGFVPTSTILRCEQNGAWNPSPPSCSAATCPDDVYVQPRNPAVFTQGPYSYGARVDLNCTKGVSNYLQFRHCTYDPSDDMYKLQGSPYDCGVVDCGPIESQFSNSGVSTIYPSQFLAQCPSGYRLEGVGPDERTIQVTCSPDGYWQYGNLSCTGVSCVDPGYPAGGDIIATSFSRGSTVSFRCTRRGYSIDTNSVTDLTCQGSTWSPPTALVDPNGCIDTEAPIFSGNCDSSIEVDRYDFLPPLLPSISVTDNTGIESYSVFPENANTTLYVAAPLRVTYTAVDYFGNDATCNIDVNVRDETPPDIGCPPIQTLLLDTETDSEVFSLSENLFAITDNIQAQTFSLITDLPKQTFTVADLYATYTYSAQVTDTSNNVDTCKGQVFISPSPGCVELRFQTPLNAQKTCRFINSRLECEITCDAGYTFQNFAGRTRTVTCSNGIWSSLPIPACVQDVTKPVITCPSSQVVPISEPEQTVFRDFTDLTNTDSAYTVFDLNTISYTVVNLDNKTFDEGDLYQTTEVTLSVEDAAGNEATCRFQYTLLPEVCSPLSMPRPANGKANVCTRRSIGITGYDCTLECLDGYVLRGHGNTKTISCNDGQPWPEVYPGCILDTTDPVVVCPQSRTVLLSSSTESYEITFGEGDFIGRATDVGGLRPLVYSIPVLEVNSAIVNQRIPISMTAIDLRGNQNSCNFNVVVLAPSCSDLSIPEPLNGNKTCVQNANLGWTCTFYCDPGFSFVTTTSSTITSTCNPSESFNVFVPACVSDSASSTPRQFEGTLRYQYRADSDVSEACRQNYLNRKISSATAMAGRMRGLCDIFLDFNVIIDFLESRFTAVVSPDLNGNARVVTMDYYYTFEQADNFTVMRNCSDVYDREITALQAFEFGEAINDIQNCPNLNTAFFADQTDADFYCPIPYFESLQNSDTCALCPAGMQSTQSSCIPCPVNTYRPSSSLAQCVDCSNGGKTRYPGATAANQCLGVCGGGSISSTGFEPCYPCDFGYYSINSTFCQACPPGLTTTFFGATDPNSCVNTTLNNLEPCSAGTQPNNAGGCDLCDFGTYRTAQSGPGTCIPCTGLTSTFIQGAVSPDSCTGLCAGGLVSSDGKAPCTMCPKGTYYVNSTYCQPCNPGFTTDGIGKQSFQDCVSESLLRVNCPRGTYRTNSGDCLNCQVGTYQSFENQLSCQSCGNGRSTYVTGAVSFAQCFETCAPGFSSNTGLSPCTPCGVGRYWVSSTLCSDCPNGGTTANNTAASQQECLAPCLPGSFSFSGYDQDGACRACPQNYYQGNSQSTSCIRCADNLYSTQASLTSDSECQPATAACDCQNGGTCVAKLNGAFCICPQGYFGPTCSQVVNYCLSEPCYNNGTCSSSPSGHSCDCRGLATGVNCEVIVKTCDTTGVNPTCKNGGHCINRPGFTECLCPDGFSGSTCERQALICNTKPCNTTGSLGCEDVSFDSNLRRRCNCRPGYGGDDCSVNIDDCESNPCINGGQCIDLVNGFFCACENDYAGTYCQNRPNRCTNVNCGPSLAMCTDKQMDESSHCICPPGYAYGSYDQYSIVLAFAPRSVTQTCSPGQVANVDECRQRCSNSGTCAHFAYQQSTGSCCLITTAQAVDFIEFTSDPFNLYTKNTFYPEDDFYTMRYDLNDPITLNRDSESRMTMNDDYGLNICSGTTPLEAKCCIVGDDSCGALPVGVTCNIDGLACNGVACENTDFDISFKCAVQRVFVPNTCTIKSDYCDSNPCVQGACSNTFKGYICSCPPGYSGLNCQTNINECETMPCQNNATCIDGINSYTCDCPEGFEGFNCQSRVNYCANLNVNCNGRGSCQNLQTDYQCTCFAGYEGKDCEDLIDFCLSEPCLHGSTCDPVFNDYNCNCVPGWTGKNCDEVVDNCLPQFGGSQCLADCKNIFNDYYCECPDNTFGRNCENQPNPCGDYNKCQNSATCSVDAGGVMNCQCPTKYTGDGCQILLNHCGLTNRCENNAMCMVTDSGYNCTCPTGYTGTNCQTEINECEGVLCPGNGQCYDGIGTFYCRCPLKRTGENCNRLYDPNYDLYFSDPMAYAWIPYFIQVLDTGAVSASFWVRFSTVGGEGIYMTQYVGDKLDTSVKFMELTHEGLTVYGADPDNRLNHKMRFTRNSLLNDGNWHLVMFSFDTVQGLMTLYLDTIRHDQYQDAGIMLGVIPFRMWLILGCEFDKTMKMCKGTNSFHGYLSQINWYRKILGFVEADQVFQDPRLVFDPIEEVILVWNENVLESGSDRIIPSQASGTLCSVADRPIPCSFFTVEPMPMVTGCPNDMPMNTNGERQVTLTWTEPKFSNLGQGGRTLPPEFQSGSLYTWGIYDVVYVGVSDTNFTSYCSFRVYVQESFCPVPEPPFSGRDPACVDNNPIGRKGCRISCYNGYVIDRVTPQLFTCDPSGTWNYARRFDRYRYPACGEVKAISPKVRVNFGFVYEIGTTACLAVKQNLQELLEATLSSLNGIYNGNLYVSFSINIACGDEATGRRKRQTSTVTTVAIELNDADPITVYATQNISVSEFLTYQAIGLRVFDYADIFRAIILEELFTVTVSPSCAANEVVINNQCVECGGGNFFRYTDATNTTAICDDCPIGSYQPTAGQFSCVSCNAGETTELPGAYESTACKTSCSVGFFFNRTADACSPCPIGYYQDETGKFRCKGCAAGFTTEFVGTNSSDRCTGVCDNGQQLDGNGNCEECPVGTYRNISESRLCKACDAGFITAGTGAKSSAECTVTACEPGNRLNTNTNQCETCPLGTYQNNKWQTSCISCGDPTLFLTLTTGSSSQNDCIFYCPPGYEVVSGSQSCNPCPIGTYKQGNLGMCEGCSGNFRTPNVASTSPADCSIFKCPAGSSPNATNDGCSPCALGTYQDVEFSEKCNDCGPGNSTRNLGSASPNDCEVFCPSGQQKVQGTCEMCDRGTYKSNSDGLFSMCQPCSEEFTTVGMGATSASDCIIRTCPAGTRRNSDDTSCEDCPLGTYQPQEFQTMCLNCSEGTSTRQVKSVNASQCELFCADGLEKNAQGGCDACLRGYYKDNNDGLFGLCQLCPIENITVTVGSTKLSDCFIGNCTKGQRLRLDNTCEPCPKGTYQNSMWQSFCRECGTDKTTQFVGSTSEDDCILVCQPGNEDVGGLCQPCPQGTFKVEEAAARCNQCPNDTITESTGANSSALCVLPACAPGNFLDRVTDPQNPVCKPCDYDTYQNEKWQESCKPCPNSEVTLKTGAMAVTDCVSDCPSGQEYNSNTDACDFCQIGYYRDKTDRLQTGCQLCDIRFITPSTGSTSSASCTIANCTTPGEYRDTTDNTCKPCPLGTYNSQKWRTFCDSCGDGFSTRNTGSSSSSDCIPVCPLGEVVGANNLCEACPIGFYKDIATAETCTECPNRLLTPRTGSVSASDCSLSPCSAGQSYDLSNQLCNDCPTGTYQPNAGNFSCITCENGYDFTPTTKSTSSSACNSPCQTGQQFNNATKACQPCPQGYYQDRANEFVCTRCPPGLRFTENTGSTSLTQCLSFCSGQANPCSINATCNTAADGAVCSCFVNYDDVGSPNGTQCVHVCDRGYCLNDRPCNREPTPSCVCGEYLEGDRCEIRKEGQSLSDDTKDIIVGVTVGVGGLILILIILAVCCLCWKHQRQATNKAPTRYSEFNGDRVDKASLQSYDYGQRPYNGGTPRLMLAPYPEVVYDNDAYLKENVEGNGSIDSAVYHA